MRARPFGTTQRGGQADLNERCGAAGSAGRRRAPDKWR